MSDQKKSDVAAGRPYLGCWEYPSEKCEECGCTAEEVWLLGTTGQGICRKCLDARASEAASVGSGDASR